MKKLFLIGFGVMLCFGLLGCTAAEIQQAESEINTNEYGTESIAYIESMTRNGEYTSSDSVTITAVIMDMNEFEKTGDDYADKIYASIFAIEDNSSSCTVALNLEYDFEELKVYSAGDQITLTGYPVIKERVSGEGNYFSLEDCTIV